MNPHHSKENNFWKKTFRVILYPDHGRTQQHLKTVRIQGEVKGMYTVNPLKEQTYSFVVALIFYSNTMLWLCKKYPCTASDKFLAL